MKKNLRIGYNVSDIKDALTNNIKMVKTKKNEHVTLFSYVEGFNNATVSFDDRTNIVNFSLYADKAKLILKDMVE